MIELSPEQLIEYARKNRWLVINKEDVGQDLVCHNIAPKREKDDLVYQDPVVKHNFRRGLTLIEELKDFKRVQLKVARKGLRRFDYLHPEFLTEDVRIGKNLASLKSQFLEGVDRFKGVFKVHAIEKANGQNCQVSFTNNHWIICSKNRALFIQKGGEIPWKERHLYGFRLEIAALWFQILKNMSVQLVSELEKQLETKTLIGQYCDSIGHQHIVQYQKPALVFYSVVEKTSSDNCMLVEQSYKLFEHFGLNTARILVTKEAKTPTQLYQFLDSMYRTITKSSIKECGEGAVIYIEGQVNGVASSISLWKVKSIQYLILRRLREKLVQYLKKCRKSTKTLQKKYTEEIMEMSEHSKPHSQLDYYVRLGQKAFAAVEDGDRLALKFVVNKFISFLQFLDQKHQDIKADFIRLVGNSSKQLEALEEVEEEVAEDQVSEELKTEGQNPKQQLKLLRKKIVILLPLTIPSSGKTSLFKTLKDMDFELEIVSSDTCRGQIMDQLKLKDKKASHQQLYDKSLKAAKTLFYSTIKKVFNSLQASKSENCLLVIDKNHPSNSLPSTLKQLGDIIGNNNKNVKIVALIPNCKNPVEEKGKFSYPFSMEYLVTSLKRVIGRQTHETLMGSSYKKVNVVTSFFNMYRGFRFNKYNLGKFFDSVLQIQMFNQSIPSLTNEIRELVLRVLTSVKPGSFDQSPYTEELVTALDNVTIEEIPLVELTEVNRKKIEAIFANFDQLSFQDKP